MATSNERTFQTKRPHIHRGKLIPIGEIVYSTKDLVAIFGSEVFEEVEVQESESGVEPEPEPDETEIVEAPKPVRRSKKK